VDYVVLRDSVVAPLIVQFGRSAVLRKETTAYTPATGTAVVTPSDTAVKIVELSASKNLKGAPYSDHYSETEVQQWDSEMLISAKETAVAAVVPSPGDVVVVGSSLRRVIWVNPIAPSGVDVVYKAGVARL
jgi:hypothetical protein